MTPGTPHSAMHSVGKYRIEREVARGGAGVVYAGRDPQGTQVAVKVLIQGGSAGNVARFGREVSALQRLNHPGIVRLHAAGTTPDGHRYLVMDFVEGTSLAERLRRGPLPISFSVQLINEVALALASAHAEGVLHRDVKPDNVILTPDGRVRLTDFGLAVDEDGSHSLTTSGAILGTPGYMPPEQVLGELEKLGPPADVYGLGATLFACLTGGAPFEGQAWDVMAATTDREPVPPSRLRSGIDSRLDAICIRCLQKTPRARYPDAGALSAALEAYLGGELAPPARRAGWVPAALVLVACGTLLGWLVSVPADPAEPADFAESAGPVGPAQPVVGEAEVTPVQELGPKLFATLARLELEDRPEQALALSEPLLSQYPDHPLLLSHVGREHTMTENRERGLPLLKRATELGPELATVWLHWGSAWTHHDPEAAREAIRRSLELQPSAPARAIQAQLHLMEDRYRAAAADLEQAAELDPDYPHVHAVWALYHAQRGDLEEAQNSLTRAIEAQPSAGLYELEAQLGKLRKDPPEAVLVSVERALACRETYRALEMKALILEEQRRFAEAERVWTSATERYPAKGAPWHQLCRLRAEVLGKLELAVENGRRAVELKPEALGFRLMLAMALDRADASPEALPLLDRLLDERPDSVRFRFTRALVRLHTEDYEGAWSDAEAVLRKEPRNPRALEIASVSLSASQPRGKQALAIARRWLAVEPEHPLAVDTFVGALWFATELKELLAWTDSYLARGAPPRPLIYAFRGFALWEQGQAELGRACYDRALELEPRCALALTFLARLLYEEGQYSEAVREASRCLELVDMPEARLLRACSLMELGDLSAAREDLARCESSATQGPTVFKLQAGKLERAHARLAALESEQ